MNLQLSLPYVALGDAPQVEVQSGWPVMQLNNTLPPAWEPSLVNCAMLLQGLITDQLHLCIATGLKLDVISSSRAGDCVQLKVGSTLDLIVTLNYLLMENIQIQVLK